MTHTSSNPPRLTRLVCAVTCLAVACLAGSVWLVTHAHARPPALSHLVLAAGVYVSAAALRLDVRLGSQRLVIVWTDTALLLSMLLVPPVWIIPATTVGKALGLAVTYNRRQPIKIAYNTGAHVLAATLAVGCAVPVGQLPADLHHVRDLAALTLARTVYELVSAGFATAVIAAAGEASLTRVWRAGLGIQTVILAGDFALAVCMLALAARLDSRAVLVLPTAAVALHRVYRHVHGVRTERRTGRRLAEAIGALPDPDPAVVLSRTAAHAATLLTADTATVTYRGQTTTYPAAAARHPPPADTHGWSEAVELRENGRTVGSIRVYFPQQVQLAGVERTGLHALAAAAGNALAAARTHAETMHRAAVHAYEASHDRLTSLPLRHLFIERITIGLTHAAGGGVGLMLIRPHALDEVDRALGRAGRDQLARTAAKRLRRHTLLGELPGWVEEDFAVFVHQTSLDNLDHRAQTLLAVLNAPTKLDDGPTVALEATAGIAYAAAATAEPAELLRQAGLALARTHRHGHRLEYYRTADDPATGAHATLLAAELRQALTDGHLIPYYQPIIDLTDGTPIAAETLVHWAHPRRGPLPPPDWLPALDQHPDLQAIYTHWLLHRAASDRAGWHGVDPDLAVSINLPTRALLDPHLPTQVTEAMQASGLAPRQLMLELTATAALSPLAAIDHALRQLRDLGVRVAVDDITHHSPLHRLPDTAVTDLKIAPNLVEHMLASPHAHALVRATTHIAATCHLRVTATGATTPDHLAAARTAGAHNAQGTHQPTLARHAHTTLRTQTRRSPAAAQVIPLPVRSTDQPG